ncbi:MAG: helix-turn-helix domain-containing protein [Candidatus Nitrosotenuis sp.]
MLLKSSGRIKYRNAYKTVDYNKLVILAKSVKMTDEQEILKKLLVEEKDVIRDLASLVEKAKEVFVIEKPSGRVIFKEFGKLSDPQRICALLIGRYFAVKLGLLEDSSLGVSEIADELGRPKTALSGPLKDLGTKGFVEKLTNRKYVIAYHRIKDIFDAYFK